MAETGEFNQCKVLCNTFGSHPVSADSIREANAEIQADDKQ
jgi:hypothetical protein